MIELKFIPLEEGCDYIQKGINKLYNILEGFSEPNFTPHHRIMLYTTIYNMCMQTYPHNYGKQLYNMYKQTCEDYILSKVLPSLQEKKDDLFLRELLSKWSNYKIMTRRLSKIFSFLDNYEIHRLRLPSLEETSMLSFCHLVYEEMNKELMDAIFAMIDRKHAGEQIDQLFAFNILDFYFELEECSRKEKAKEDKLNRSPDVLSKKVKFISSDGLVFEVDFGVALMSKRFEDMFESIPVGDVDTISFYNVNSKILAMVIEYCKKHHNKQKDVDLSVWDAQFVDVDPETLLDLLAAAMYLKIDSLWKLTCSKEDDLFKDKTPEEIAEFFGSVKSKLLEVKNK